MMLLNLIWDLENSIRWEDIFVGIMSNVIFARQCFMIGKEVECRGYIYMR